MEDVLKKTYNFKEISKKSVSYHLESYLMEMMRFKEANH